MTCQFYNDETRTCTGNLQDFSPGAMHIHNFCKTEYHECEVYQAAIKLRQKVSTLPPANAPRPQNPLEPPADWTRTSETQRLIAEGIEKTERMFAKLDKDASVSPPDMLDEMTI